MLPVLITSLHSMWRTKRGLVVTADDKWYLNLLNYPRLVRIVDWIDIIRCFLYIPITGHSERQRHFNIVGETIFAEDYGTFRELECMRKINSTPFFTPYANWRIRLDYTRFLVRALRLRQFRDTLTSNSNQASSSNSIPIEDFMNQEWI